MIGATQGHTSIVIPKAGLHVGFPSVFYHEIILCELVSGTKFPWNRLWEKEIDDNPGFLQMKK